MDVPHRSDVPGLAQKTMSLRRLSMAPQQATNWNLNDLQLVSRPSNASAYSATSCPPLLMHLRPPLRRLFAELVVQSSLTAVVAVARPATPSTPGQLKPVARLEHVPSHQYVLEGACLQQNEPEQNSETMLCFDL